MRDSEKQKYVRWIRNHVYWWKSDLWSLPWHLRTCFGQRRIYCLHHYYQISWRMPDVYVAGRGNPDNILAYLQFLDERTTAREETLSNGNAARLLERFYGYQVLPFRHQDSAETVDLYWVREERCGHTLHQLLGCLLYHRRGLVEALKSEVEL